MTSISPSPVPSAPHVSLERSSTSTSVGSSRASVVSPIRRANVTSPTSPTARPSLPGAPSKRFSTVQSKVGSLEAIHYKPKPSEKKIQSFKQDFSHIKSKVDAKLVLPPSEPGVAKSTAGSFSVATAAGSRGGSVKRPTVVTTTSTTTTARTASRQPLSPPPSRTSSAVRTATPAVISTSAATATTTTTTATATSPRSPLHSRRSSSVSTTTSPPLSPSSPNSGSANSRRLSKHIIPTQKAQYDHVKSKVGSFDNVAYKEAGRGRPSSRASSSGGNGGAFSPNNGRSRSPSGARSSNSSNGGSTTASTTSTAQRRLSSGGSGFKIPPSKKVDYSKVRSKVGSLEFINHTPQGGNLRVFSEKLNFRETAQSKIAKEINITQFYQNEDQSFDTSIQEEHEGEAVQGQDNGEAVAEHHTQEQDESIIYGSNAGADEFEPPKNILTVLAEVTESVGEIGLEEAHS
ncbi:hypothetical protein EMPS_05859 [Entomortierella parvispora]|uniref:Microtubule-associated protein n=1 Tax=Entomortierella parvispora TaxID=205924 RepID=A0A9P3HBF6_9FUNG|nr:hypothetical protein EMPS_05859 [Entomortierella parvispora]